MEAVRMLYLQFNYIRQRQQQQQAERPASSSPPSPAQETRSHRHTHSRRDTHRRNLVFNICNELHQPRSLPHTPSPTKSHHAPRLISSHLISRPLRPSVSSQPPQNKPNNHPRHLPRNISTLSPPPFFLAFPEPGKTSTHSFPHTHKKDIKGEFWRPNPHKYSQVHHALPTPSDPSAARLAVNQAATTRANNGENAAPRGLGNVKKRNKRGKKGI